jgi:hypothetical protein
MPVCDEEFEEAGYDGSVEIFGARQNNPTN